MRWIVIIGLLLIVPGCVNPAIPPELQAVLDDPAFSEVADVVHEGNLDGLPGCWGSYETDDGIETYGEFVEFSEDEWQHMMYWSLHGVGMVVVEEGTYTVEDENTVTVVIEREWVSDPYTGKLMPEHPEDTRSVHYEVTLQGDRMNFFVPGVEADQYEGTFWRFSECP